MSNREPHLQHEVGRRPLLVAAGLGAVYSTLDALGLTSCSGGQVSHTEISESASPVASPPATPNQNTNPSHDGLRIPAFAVPIDTLTSLSEREIYQRFGLARKLGARSIRVDFDGNLGKEASPGNYDWQITNAVMEAARRQQLGVTALLTFVEPRDMIPKAVEHNDYTGRPTEQGIRDFADFAGEAMRKYNPKLYPNLIGVEVWNEWNTSGGGANPEAYLSMLRLTREQVKDANPNLPVAIGGMSPSTNSDGFLAPPDAMESLYSIGMTRKDFDAAAIHAYQLDGLAGQYFDWGTFSQIEDTPKSVWSVMNDHGDGGVPIWITECGASSWPKMYGDPPRGSFVATSHEQRITEYDSGRDYVDPNLQYLIIQSILTHKFRKANVPYDHIHPYTLMDRSDNPDPSNHYGVLDTSGEPKYKGYHW